MSDLIKRDDALRIVDVAEDEHPYKVPGLFVTYSEYNQGWSDAVDFIRSRMEKADFVPAAPRWVRCEDELPKYTGRYIVWCGVNWHGEGMYGDVMIARYDRNLQRWYVEADASLNGPICGGVRYWMPIEPPKEDA